MDDRFTPLNFMNWINEHRDLFKPPVGNKVVWKDREFIIMVVGGPNKRTDVHINTGEEFFYQLEGDMNLRIHKDNAFVDIPIRQGEIYLLPTKVPHTPQRPENTIGLVIERSRAKGVEDGFAWYCEECGNILYEAYEHITDIVTQLPPIFDRFFGNPTHMTCKQCGVKAVNPAHAND